MESETERNSQYTRKYMKDYWFSSTEQPYLSPLSFYISIFLLIHVSLPLSPSLYLFFSISQSLSSSIFLSLSISSSLFISLFLYLPLLLSLSPSLSLPLSFYTFLFLFLYHPLFLLFLFSSISLSIWSASHFKDPSIARQFLPIIILLS